jgi:hypothetical protein
MGQNNINHSNIFQGIAIDTAREKEVNKDNIDAMTISKISTKTAISPNQLIQIYQDSNGSGGVNIKSISKDFDNGKGIEKIQEKQKEFEQKKYFGEDQQEKSFVKKLDLETYSQPESFVKRIEYSNINNKDIINEMQ